MNRNNTTNYRYIKLQSYHQKQPSTYIIKPVTGCRGSGIYITKSLKNINQYEQMICQLYISKVEKKIIYKMKIFNFMRIYSSF